MRLRGCWGSGPGCCRRARRDGAVSGLASAPAGCRSASEVRVCLCDTQVKVLGPALGTAGICPESNILFGAGESAVGRIGGPRGWLRQQLAQSRLLRSGRRAAAPCLSAVEPITQQNAARDASNAGEAGAEEIGRAHV